MVKADREYRSADIKEFRADDEKYIVEGYATTWEAYLLYEDGETKIYEQVDSKAFEGTDFSDCVFNYNHEGRVYARTRNNTLHLAIDEHGLKVTADLSSTTASREMYEEIKSGLIDQMSFAFVVDDEEWDQRNHTRTIKHIRKVYDVSAVSLPANPTTEISARSWCDGVIAAEKAERLERENKRKQLLLMLEV